MRLMALGAIIVCVLAVGCGDDDDDEGGGGQSTPVAPTITTTSPLPAGFTNLPYTVTFTATGGTQPYSWDVAMGATPGGLALNSSTGQLSGSPTAASTFVFDVRVTGNDGASSVMPFSLTVTQLPSGIVYVKTNGGPGAGTTNLTTWRFNSADAISGSVSPTAAVEGPNTGQVHGVVGLQMAHDTANDRLWFTSGEKTSLPSLLAGLARLDSMSTRTGNAVVNGSIAGGNTQIVAPNGVAVDAGRDVVYVLDTSNGLIIFKNVSVSTGNRAPDAVIDGPTANFDTPLGAFIDTTNDRLYVGGGDITIDVKIYDNASTLTSGDVAPTRRIVGANTTFLQPRSVFVDVGRNLLYVGDPLSSAICVFANASTVNGNTAPTRRIVGANTTLGGFFDMTVHTIRDEIYVANEDVPSILVFSAASTTNGNVAPARVVTHPSLEEADRPPNAIALDPTR